MKRLLAWLDRLFIRLTRCPHQDVGQCDDCWERLQW